MEKPVLGIRLESIVNNAFNSERMKEIRAGLARYNSANLAAPEAWHRELAERIRWHKGHLTSLGFPLNIRKAPTLEWRDLTSDFENCVRFSQILEGSCSYSNANGFYLVGEIGQFNCQSELIFSGQRKFFPEEIRSFLPPIALIRLVSFKRFRYAEPNGN